MRNSAFPFYHDLHKSNRVPKLRLIYGLWRSTTISSFSRKSAIVRPFFLFFLNIISKKSPFITICASQIVCRSYDRYTDYGEVRKFRHFPESLPLSDHFSFFFKYNFKKKSFYHDLRKSNRVPKLRPIYGLWRSTTISSFSQKPAIVRPSFIFFKYNFKKKSFYHDLRKSNRVPKLRPIYGLWRSTTISSFSQKPAIVRPSFIFFKYNFKKKSFYHDLRKSNRVPKLRPICGLWIK